MCGTTRPSISTTANYENYYFQEVIFSTMSPASPANSSPPMLGYACTTCLAVAASGGTAGTRTRCRRHNTKPNDGPSGGQARTGDGRRAADGGNDGRRTAGAAIVRPGLSVTAGREKRTAKTVSRYQYKTTYKSIIGKTGAWWEQASILGLEGGTKPLMRLNRTLK